MATAKGGQKGSPWRVTIHDGEALPLTLLLDRRDNEWRVVGLELDANDDPTETLVRAAMNWTAYAEFARVVIPWKTERATTIRNVVRQTAPHGVTRTTTFLKAIADRYREIHDERTRPGPTTRIATEYGVSRSTASRWVKNARAAGLLGDAPDERRAGEVKRDA